jgi:hypothetical protein
VLQHLEACAKAARSSLAGLPLVDFTTEERLDEIVRMHERWAA